MKQWWLLLAVLFWTGNDAYAAIGMKFLPQVEEPKNMRDIEMERRAAEEAAKKAEDAEMLNQETETEENSTADIPTAATGEQEEGEEKVLMSNKERRLMERRQEIAEERARETSRFKKKAIANTEAREEKYEEIMKRKQEKASRFQKAAMEEAEREKEEAIKKAQESSESRFTEKAKKRAEERARKREEKQKRLRRNRKREALEQQAEQIE